MTDLGNNQKIKSFMTDKVNVDDIKREIIKRHIQIDDLFYELGGRKFSFETDNFYKRNKPFFDIELLRTEIKHYESALNKAQIRLDNSEELAKGLEWIV